jgi:hypothetical protein
MLVQSILCCATAICITTAIPTFRDGASSVTEIHVFGEPYVNEGNTVEIYKPFTAQDTKSVHAVYDKRIGCTGVGNFGSTGIYLFGSPANEAPELFKYCSTCEPSRIESVISITGNRQYSAGAQFGGQFCICGGNYAAPDTSCTCFDPTSGKFTSIPDMGTGRILFAMATLNNGKDLYAIGGVTGGKQILNTVERFSVGTTSWVPVASMTVKRNDHDAVSYGESIYVCGDGFFHANVKTCERYDSAADKWTTIASPGLAYMDFAFVPFNNYLFALGSGQPGNAEVVEYYEPAQGVWHNTTKLLELRDWVCGVAL